jgi:hypothetical protein
MRILVNCRDITVPATPVMHPEFGPIGYASWTEVYVPDNATIQELKTNHIIPMIHQYNYRNLSADQLAQLGHGNLEVYYKGELMEDDLRLRDISDDVRLIVIVNNQPAAQHAPVVPPIAAPAPAAHTAPNASAAADQPSRQLTVEEQMLIDNATSSNCAHH